MVSNGSTLLWKGTFDNHFMAFPCHHQLVNDTVCNTKHGPTKWCCLICPMVHGSYEYIFTFIYVYIILYCHRSLEHVGRSCARQLPWPYHLLILLYHIHPHTICHTIPYHWVAANNNKVPLDIPKLFNYSISVYLNVLNNHSYPLVI